MNKFRYHLALGALLLTVLTFFFVGVAPDRLTSGEVTGKRYAPEHQYQRVERLTQPGMPWTGSGTPITKTYTRPERWYITISDGEDSTEWVVTEDDYYNFDIGDQVSFK